MLVSLACQESAKVKPQEKLGAYPLSKNSFISSPFGVRNSPFTGENE